MGQRFWGAYQSESDTLQRITEGQCLIAEINNRIVGTCTYRVPMPKDNRFFYHKPGVGVLGQFAVHPEYQGTGIGAALLREIEALAIKGGASELALDTSEQTLHLIDYYGRKGFRFIEYIQWGETNYRSVIMSKCLI